MFVALCIHPGVTAASIDSESPKPVAVPKAAARSTPPIEGEGDVVRSKPSIAMDVPSDRSLRSRSTTPTPAILIEPDGSLELTADMINGIDSEVITSDTLQSAKARGSNNTDLGVIIPSDDESVDGDLLLCDEEDDEGERRTGERVRDGEGDQGERGGATSAVGGGLEGTSADGLPGSTPNRRTRAVKRGSEEEGSHDHERTPQPTDPQEKSLELADGHTETQAASQGPTDNVSS